MDIGFSGDCLVLSPPVRSAGENDRHRRRPHWCGAVGLRRVPRSSCV